MLKFGFIAAAIVIAGGAQAQDIYGGVSFDYNLPHKGASQTAATVLVGVATPTGMVDVNVEAEYGAASVFGGDYDTARLRLLGMFDVGTLNALASVGGTRYATDAASFTGYNLGLGVQLPFSDGMDVRVEMIRDMMGDFGTNVTTTRLGVIYQF